jgi:HlyD family secretion protein
VLPLLILALVGCGRGETGAVQSSADLVTIERRDLEIRAESAGLIEPVRVVEVKSKVSGELLQLGVETGQEVQQGEVIAMIDPRDVRNTLQQADADLGLARARVETTAAQRRRAERLAQEGLLSAQDLETTQLEETNARAQLLKAQTNRELAREKMGDVTIRAPIAGTVIEKTVEQGQIIASASANVSGGTTLVKMADLATVQARALVDEVDIGQIRPGQPTQVTVEAYPGRTFRGSVAKIEPQAVVEQNVTMFPVLVQLPNPERLLKPGMNAEVAIEIADRTNVVAVPNGAIVSPREAPVAAEALGLDETEVRTRLAQMRQQRGGRQPGGRTGADGTNGADRGERRRAWRERGERGGSQSGGPGGEGFQGGANGGPSASGARPGVVFVKGASGPEPRMVLLGLSDWDHSEVLRGLEPGTEVYVVSVARLQQQQQRFADRMRERAGAGSMLGGGQQRSGGSAGGQSGGSR